MFLYLDAKSQYPNILNRFEKSKLIKEISIGQFFYNDSI